MARLRLGARNEVGVFNAARGPIGLREPFRTLPCSFRPRPVEAVSGGAEAVRPSGERGKDLRVLTSTRPPNRLPFLSSCCFAHVTGGGELLKLGTVWATCQLDGVACRSFSLPHSTLSLSSTEKYLFTPAQLLFARHLMDIFVSRSIISLWRERLITRTRGDRLRRPNQAC